VAHHDRPIPVVAGGRRMRRVTLGNVTYVGADDDVAAAVAPRYRFAFNALARSLDAITRSFEEFAATVGRTLTPAIQAFTDAWLAASGRFP
jgi:hypothetical protein